MALKFKASETFWTRFYALSSEQKKAAREKWEMFKQNPFDPALKTHKINRLSALMGTTVYGIKLGDDLRVTFYRDFSDEELIRTITIGDHDIYERL